MRPSGSLTCESGVERGTPWGRDLFTFVTSAAGHMMRTLQKPRKNRPSKRQVNHRRFLHNMIHRKFAEIEAANRQLASAIFSRDKEDGQDLSPCQVVITDQSDETKQDTSANLALSLPQFTQPLCLPGNPETENIPEGESDQWAYSFQLESFGEQTVEVHNHVISTANQNTDTVANHLTLTKGDLDKMAEVADIMSGELNLCEQPNEPEVHFSFEEEPLKLDSFMRLSEIVLGENPGDATEDFQNQSRTQSLTPRAQLSNMENSVLKSTPLFPSEPQSQAPCAFGIQVITNSHCSWDSTNSIDEFHLDDFDVNEEDYLNLQPLSMSFCEADNEDVANCKLHFGSANLNYDDNNGLSTTENQQFSSQCVNLGRGYCTSRKSSGCDTYKTGQSNCEGLGESPYFSNKNVEMTSPFNQRDGSGFDYFTAIPSTLVSYDQVRTDEGMQHGDIETSLSMKQSCSYDLAESSGSSVPPFLRLFHSHQVAVERMQSDTTQRPDSGMLGCSKPTSDNMVNQQRERCGDSNAECARRSCSHAQTGLSCRKVGTDQNQHLFLGVARSFPAPSPKAHLTRILTPPVEEGWLFDDITEVQITGREKVHFSSKRSTIHDSFLIH